MAVNDKPALIRASDVPYEEPRFLIAPYYLLGKGTLIQGENGSGKTALLCAHAAHVSTGAPIMGIPIQSPGNVLLLSVEDDLPILRGRIEASGGDLTRCFFMSNAAGLTFTSPVVEKAIEEIDARFIGFDPLQAFLGSGVDLFRPNETRPALAKLFEMCQRHNTACAIIAHMGKNAAEKSAVNRSLGSVDIPASMRSIIQVARNPEDPDECIAVHVKCSNAPRGRSIRYTIGERGGVTFTGFSDMDAQDIAVQQRRRESGIEYEHEPLVQVFNQLVTDEPNRGFWSYSDLKRSGAKILGFPPFSDLSELRNKLDRGLARELQKRDGLIVSHSEKAHGNQRGVRIEKYSVPQGYQTRIAGSGYG